MGSWGMLPKVFSDDALHVTESSSYTPLPISVSFGLQHWVSRINPLHDLISLDAFLCGSGHSQNASLKFKRGHKSFFSLFGSKQLNELNKQINSVMGLSISTLWGRLLGGPKEYRILMLGRVLLDGCQQRWDRLPPTPDTNANSLFNL